MSYILDALKKAESERERGVVPGLNSAQANHATFIHYGSDQKPWWILALVLGVLLVGLIALWGWRQTAAAPSTALTPSEAQAVAAVTPVAVSAQAQTPKELPPVEAKTPPAPVPKPELPARAPVLAAAPAATLPSPLQAAASTVAHVQTKVAPPPASPSLPAATAVSVEASSKPAPVSAPIRSASGGVPMLSELPEPMRRQIPALNISGAVYSDSPPEWTLIINDQLIGKGGQVAPDMRLEEVSASSAVFNFKGQRFRMER